jgi:hypothetical protein
MASIGRQPGSARRQCGPAQPAVLTVICVLCWPDSAQRAGKSGSGDSVRRHKGVVKIKDCQVRGKTRGKKFGVRINQTGETLAMDLFALKSSPSPVVWTAATVGHGDDLDGGVCKSINYRVGETAQEKLPCAVQVQRPALRAVGNVPDGVIDGGHECVCSRGIAFGVPLVRSFCLSDGARVEFNAWASHGIVQGSADAPRTRELPSLSPYPIHQCVARFPCSTLLQHSHRPSHLSFPADDQPERPVFQPANVTLLHKPFCDWTSWFQIKRQIAARQSLPAIAINPETAKQIGVTIPPNVPARADRVIR